jgi:SRSO17 transposase
VAATELAQQVPARAWKRLSAGHSSKGERLYDWTWIPPIAPMDAGWGRWLLVRRSLEDSTELAYYGVFAPRRTTQRQAVRVAGSRWTVESCLEEAKGETGLDEYEVRTWRSWHRHITLSMMAHAFLAWARYRATAELETAPKRAAGKKPRRSS